MGQAEQRIGPERVSLFPRNLGQALQIRYRDVCLLHKVAVSCAIHSCHGSPPANRCDDLPP
jgi:hypothetical protein